VIYRSLSPGTLSRRAGLSLLEVLVALAVFLMALGGLFTLLNYATRRAQEVQMRSQAARLCQSKLAEVLSGALPLTGQDGAAFDEDPDYQWSLTSEQGAVTGLWNITVKVSWGQGAGGRQETALSQMVLDPSIIGSTQDTVQMTATDPSAGTGTTSSSSASGSSGQSTNKTSSSAKGSSRTGATSGSSGKPAGGNTGGSGSKPGGGNTGGSSGKPG